MFADLEVEIYIRPEGGYQGNVAVIITPEQLAPGDTASITFKRRFLNGSLEDFPEEQRFEIGMLEGCDAGNLLFEGDLSTYFNNVTQPIYFLADSNITESDTVLIRVGVIDDGGGGGGASRPMKTNEKDREIITLRKNKTTQQKPLGENTATYCFIGEIDWSKMGDGIVVVGDGCDTWSCLSGFNDFNGLINIQEVEQDYNDINYCLFSSEHQYPPAAGIFKPLFDEVIYNSISEKIKDQLLVNFNLEVCYMNYDYNGYWRYRISENSIFLRAILDVCEENILNSGTEFIIHNKSELSIIPNE
jgi:hypothetical protein